MNETEVYHGKSRGKVENLSSFFADFNKKAANFNNLKIL